MTDPLYLWLEPGRTDLDEGLRARVADPLWFLARQWQLGELHGEDASSPVAVDVTTRHQPVSYDRRRPDLDPTVVPAEALLEAEPGDWWTIGRRVRLGRAAAALLAPADVDAFRFGTLPAPYDRLADEIDGRAVFVAGVLAGNPVFAEVPTPLSDRWSRRRLDYTATFEAGGTALQVPGHDGGDVDWFSVDGVPDAVTITRPDSAPALRRLVVPNRLDYPGAPNPRWWQLEDRAVDIGGFAPDRSHLATMLLSDVALSHSDDWFSFHVPPPFPDPPAEPDHPLAEPDHPLAEPGHPLAEPGHPLAEPVEAPPSSGVLVRLSDVTVRDSFDQIWPLAPPPVTGAGAWSLFHTTGLDPADLLIWPVAVAPNRGPLLDDVLIGVDEDANLAWAVELSADGRQLLTDADTDAAIAETSRTGSRDFRYLPSTTLPDHWHPYQRIRIGDPGAAAGEAAGDGRSGSWRQAVLADLTGPFPRPRPGPISRLIGGPSGPGLGRGHELDPTAIPSNGVRLQRRAMLARDTEGRPVLWVERSSRPVTGPPTSHLRFDVFAEDAR